MIKRLDKFIADKRKDFSRSLYKKFISKVGVTVNGKIIKKPDFIVKDKDTIVVSSDQIADFLRPLKKDSEKNQKIIFDSNGFFIADKPPFVSTEEYIGDFLPVHRLDKNTSGVLVIAKNPVSQALLQEQWKAREVKKTYLALVKGHLSPLKGAIEGGIARSRKDRTKMSISNAPKARNAFTEYEVVKYFNKASQLNSDLTLLKAFPATGRTHQIRVHLAGIGHPVCGDAKYGDKALNKAFLVYGLNRQFLHALELQLVNPDTKERISFKSDLYEDLKTVLNSLNS